MGKRVLFVDDEPNVLQGLRRMLWSMRDEWELEFAAGGQEALHRMAQAPFDVIVTDMRMPGMDGVELLRQVVAQNPETVRIMLSGQAEKDTMLHSFGLAHQFLSKPCDAATLKKTVDRAFSLRALLDQQGLKDVASRMTRLPSLPGVYRRVLEELESEDPSARRIGDIIEHDLAMSVKILQVVNSPFFGMRHQVTSPSHAVSLLGLNAVRSIMLVIHTFEELDPHSLCPDMPYDTLLRHSLRVGAYARAITASITADHRMSEDAYTAGLLHDIGKLLLSANYHHEYGTVLQLVREQPMSYAKAETAVFGATHAEFGAYLIGLWGLADSLIDATAYHHKPERAAPQGFSVASAVHVADVLAHEIDDLYRDEARPLANTLHLKNLLLEDKLSDWRILCRRIDASQHVDAQS